MGLFRSKTETYPQSGLTADIERGLVARYLARVLERGDLPLRGLLTVLRWLNERRDQLSLEISSELSQVVTEFYLSGGITFADLDRVYAGNRDRLIASLRAAAEATPRPEPLATKYRAPD